MTSFKTYEESTIFQNLAYSELNRYHRDLISAWEWDNWIIEQNKIE